MPNRVSIENEPKLFLDTPTWAWIPEILEETKLNSKNLEIMSHVFMFQSSHITIDEKYIFPFFHVYVRGTMRFDSHLGPCKK